MQAQLVVMPYSIMAVVVVVMDHCTNSLGYTVAHLQLKHLRASTSTAISGSPHVHPSWPLYSDPSMVTNLFHLGSHIASGKGLPGLEKCPRCWQ